MWRIITIISGIVLVASAWIGLLNNKKLQAEETSLNDNQVKLARTEKDLADVKQLLADTTQQRDDKVALTKKQDSEKDTLVAKNEAMTSEIATLDAKHKDEAKKLADLQEKMKDAPNLDELEDKIKATKQQDAQMAQDIVDSEAKLAAAEGRIKALETQVKVATQKEEDIRNHLSPAELKARIVNVNNALGYVIINAGVNSDVVGNSRLAVMRGSDKIAELLVAGVEPSCSAADIVPGTLREGYALMPGDSVIAIRELPKTEDEKAAAKTVKPAAQKKPAEGEAADGDDIFGDDASGDDTATDDDSSDEDTSTDGEDAGEEDSTADAAEESTEEL